MGAWFDIIMLLMLVIIVGAAVGLVRRTQQRRAAWESGLTAHARVIRAWTTTRTVNNVPQRVQWHEYDYTTVDGRAVRFKESGGPRHRAEGDLVPVYYAPHDPDKATAAEPQPGKDLASTVVWLGVLTAAAIVLMREWATLPRF
ncbi:DUF3592 domain-containing protein [Streptomyces sp. NPDC002671]